MKRWPLVPIAAPAAVAVWSGWVGLGGMCGFGIVHPLPGIVDSFTINSAITLPVGVEAYGAYALGAWLTPGTPETARTFARRSAVGALTLGMLGQVVYHLLAAAHRTRAPWPVVVLVACLPVITLGFGAALTHLLRDVPETAPETAPGSASESAPEGALESAPQPAPVSAPVTVTGPVPESAPESAPQPVSESAPETAPVSASEPAPASAPQTVSAGAPKRAVRRAPKRTKTTAPKANPEVHFAAELASGELPSARRIRSELHVGQPKAQQIRAQLEAAMAGTAPAEQ